MHFAVRLGNAESDYPTGWQSQMLHGALGGFDQAQCSSPALPKAQAVGIIGINNAGALPALSLRGPLAQASDDQLAQALRTIPGTWCLCTWDTGGGSAVIAATDPLAEFPLFYRIYDDGFAVATDPRCLQGKQQQLDPTFLAAFFGLRSPSETRSYWQDVKRIPAGHALVIEDRKARLLDYQPWQGIGDLDCDDGVWGEKLIACLDRSVERCIGSGKQPAVMMSGGMDSTTIAALAKRQGRNLRTVSWGFSKFPKSDETPWIQTMQRRLNLNDPVSIADSCIPLRSGMDELRFGSAGPYHPIHYKLHERMFELAVERGCDVVLNGEGGDHLFSGWQGWLASLLATRRWREAAGGLRNSISGPRDIFRSGLLRTSVARVVGVSPSRARIPQWLTADAGTLLDQEGATQKRADGARKQQISTIQATMNSWHSHMERDRAQEFGLRIARPYRDPDLVRLLLSVPTHLLFRPGWNKWLLRLATQALLPEEIRHRREFSSLVPVARDGLFGAAFAELQTRLKSSTAVWRGIVEEGFINKGLNESRWDLRDSAELSVLWACICLEAWHECP